jgi:hypothetical protein
MLADFSAALRHRRWFQSIRTLAMPPKIWQAEWVATKADYPDSVCGVRRNKTLQLTALSKTVPSIRNGG